MHYNSKISKCNETIIIWRNYFTSLRVLHKFQQVIDFSLEVTANLLRSPRHFFKYPSCCGLNSFNSSSNLWLIKSPLQRNELQLVPSSPSGFLPFPVLRQRLGIYPTFFLLSLSLEPKNLWSVKIVLAWLVGWLVSCFTAYQPFFGPFNSKLSNSCLVCFHGISTIVGYLMSNPFSYIYTVLFQTIQFSISTQFKWQNRSISNDSV